MTIRPEFQVTRNAAMKTRRPPKPKVNPVHTIKVNPQVWQAALDAADHDAHRIEVVSPHEVLVHNSRR